MEPNTEQADALMKCVEVAPSYGKITHVTRRVNELLDLSYTDAKWRGLLKDNPSEHERIKKALGTAKDETPDTIHIDGNIIGAVVNDVHVPYHDKVAISLACKVLAWWKPEVLIYNGDLLDFYDLSRYDKNPGRQYRLQDEIDLFHTDVIAPVKRFRQIQQIISRGTFKTKVGAEWRTGQESPCLCTLTPEYMRVPDWQQGITLFTVTDKICRIYPVEFSGQLAQFAKQTFKA